MHPSSEDQIKQRLHAIIDRAFDTKTGTRVVFLVYEQQTLSIQALGVNDEDELHNIMFHSNALIEGAVQDHSATLQ